MSGRATQQIPLKTAAYNFFQARKQDFFFLGIAVFALGMVARNEAMKKGLVKAPTAPAVDIRPKVERKRKQRADDEN